jgi:hypothetical protein
VEHIRQIFYFFFFFFLVYNGMDWNGKKSCYFYVFGVSLGIIFDF